MMSKDQIGDDDGNGDGYISGYGNSYNAGYGDGFGYSYGDGYGNGRGGKDITHGTENPYCTRLINGDNIAFIHCQQVMLS